MHWMRHEARSQMVTSEGHYSGIILDEMAIQEDLQNSKYKTWILK